MKTPKNFDLDQAVKDLAIDRPVMRVEPRENGRYRLFLYGGGTIDWPVVEQVDSSAPLTAPRSPLTPPKTTRKRKQ